MDGKVTQVVLVVTNQSRSLQFFTEQVGFEKKTDVRPPGGDRWVTVGLRGQELELALWQVGSAVDPSQREASKNWTPGSAPPVVVLVPDCRKTFEDLKERGVDFLLPPIDYPWGTVATFKDPDGNLFSMTQPRGAWSTG